MFPWYLHKKLQHILSDKNSPFKEVYYDEILTVPTEDDADAVRGDAQTRGQEGARVETERVRQDASPMVTHRIDGLINFGLIINAIRIARGGAWRSPASSRRLPSPPRTSTRCARVPHPSTANPVRSSAS